MTLPRERIQAVNDARELLYGLASPQALQRIPKAVRAWARGVLKHYPTALDMERPAKAFKA